MALVPITSDHLYMLLASIGIHLTYFYLIKTFIPFFGRDRRRLSWVLTLSTALIVSIAGPMFTMSNMRTVLHTPIPYEKYAATPGGEGFYRYDIVFESTTPPAKYPATMMRLQAQDQAMMVLEPGLSTNQQQQQQQRPLLTDQDKLEQLPAFSPSSVAPPQEPHHIFADRIAFYKAYDASFLTPSSWSTRLSSWWTSPGQNLRNTRLFFDLRFTPSDTVAAQAGVIFFACYLILDMVCGLLHYRERVSLLTGWFHHTIYVAVCFYTVRAGASYVFISYFIIEVPTIIMGLGFIHKPLRNDMLFGAAFILLRVLYDFSLTHEIVMNRPDLLMASKAILIFKSVMNFKFFIDWINQQIRLRRKSRAANRTAVGTDVDTMSSISTTVESETRHIVEIKAGGGNRKVVVDPTLSTSSWDGKSNNANIISILFQQPKQIEHPSLKQQQSQHGKRKGVHGSTTAGSSSTSPSSSPSSSEAATTSSSSPSLSSGSGVKNRGTRSRSSGTGGAGNRMEDRALADLITVN